MKKNRKPYDPRQFYRFVFIVGPTTLIATAACVMYSFKQLTLGNSDFLLLPIVPPIIYFILCVIEMIYAFYRFKGDSDERE